MIWHIFRKDWTLLWPLAVLVTAIQIAFEWGSLESGFAGANPVAAELVHLLELPWYIGIVAIAIAVVHEDPIPGADQDWLIRPLLRTDLLLAKFLFVLASVCLPMLVVNLAHELALGFPWMPSFADALYKMIYLFLCLVVPAMAVASVTRNMTDLLVLLAGLVVVYAASLWLSAALFGASRCPTCDTGVSWLQHLLQHVGTLIGSAVILGLQYYRRRTGAARLVAAVGVLLLVFIQLPWSAAFSLQTLLEPAKVSEPVVALDADAIDVGAGRKKPGGARLTTQALLQGNVDAAVESLKRISRPEDTPVMLTVPVNVTGMSQHGFLVADRAEFSVIDAHGTVLYHGKDAPHGATPLLRQSIEIPAALYKRIWPRAARLSLDYSLTLMEPGAEHRIRAVDGEFRAPDVGLCQTSADANGIHLRCRQIGRAPSCYAATLYGPEGQHNPQVLECSADYRPYIPSPLNIVNYAAIDLPTSDSYGLAHYDVELSDLPRSYVVFNVYAASHHFRETVSSPVHLAE